MKEEWLKDIHDQMADYQFDEPSGLWEGIQAKRLEESKKRRRTLIALWAKRFVASVAVVALLFTVGHLLNEKEKSSVPAVVHIPASKNDREPNNTPELPVTQQDSKTMTNDSHSGNTERKRVVTNKKENIQTKRKLHHSQTEKTLSIEENQVVVTPSLSKERIDFKNPLLEMFSQKRIHFQQVEKEKSLLDEIADIETHQKTSKRLSFGLFTAGGTGASVSRASVNEPPVYVDEPSDSQAEWIESGLLRTLATIKNEKEGTHTKHRLPIRMGILFSYQLSECWSLGSGVTYANLTSDKREGNEVLYFTSEQQLHFVGIPLHVRYRVFAWQGLEFYTSFGTLAEKNVSGKQIKTYFFENQITQTENETFTLKPWQWSVNAAMGTEYRFSPWLSMYAEPGVSYYFNNGSPVETIYKSKPFNFNLNLGVRLSF